MILRSTLTSPYGRLARILRLEKGLEDRIEFEVVATRGVDNPYYAINPSGRVPSLILDDGTCLEDSTLVCWYLDNLDGTPTLHGSTGLDGLEHRRLEASARSMLDGVSLWSREFLYREEAIRSQTTIDHERGRALRMADMFENEMENPVLTGPLNMAQITLACLFAARLNNSPDGFTWQDSRPKLSAWVERISALPSVTDTTPPPRN
jgi:glutathione S-transferase